MIEIRILDLLVHHSYSFAQLKEIFMVDDYKLNEALNSLIDQGKIVKNRNEFYLPKSLGLIRGKIISMKAKYSFADISLEEDVYISNDNLNSAFKGDEVFLKKDKTAFKDNEYIVFSIIKRAKSTFVGEVETLYDQKILNVDGFVNDDFVFVLQKYPSNILDGTIVLVRIIKQTKKYATCEVIAVVGNKNEPGVDISRIILSNDAPLKFPLSVIKEVEGIPTTIENENIKGYKDFKDHLIVTIDGDDAKDFDDAVEVEKYDGYYQVGVHIADVSHYVTKDSEIDKEALNRATSLYASDRVVPMLPFELSNGICSLNPNVDRLVMSCLFKVKKDGTIYDTKIYQGIIRSKARLTYNYANKILHHQEVEKHFDKEIDDLIFNLYEVANIIRKRRNKAGALNLESTELKFIVDKNGDVLDIIKRTQDVGEALIEDLMVTANEVVASKIEQLKLPFIYRIHDQPQARRMDTFVNISNHLGYPCSFSSLDVTPKELSMHLDKVSKVERPILSNVLLRCLAKAKYSTENVGHYGLASTCYTHFTSPIRRYPDLIVHRLLKRYLIEDNLEDLVLLKDELNYLAEDTSFKERRALNIERSVDDLLSAKYMSSKIGEQFEGIIDGMSNNGMFIELTNGISGFVPYESLSDDYYVYDEKYMKVYGKRRGARFNLGDKAIVKVLSVDVSKSQITFTLEKCGNYNANNSKINKEHKNRKSDFHRKRKRR